MLTALSLAVGLGALGHAITAGQDYFDGACPAGQGVTVVVQATSEPTELTVRCAHGEPTTALTATEAAGFAIEFVPGQPGFVCVIDSLPELCNGAPADAYWSYWKADAGTWQYATRGAGTDAVLVDDWVGWAFGSGQAPHMDPGDSKSVASPGSEASGAEVAGAINSDNSPGGEGSPWGLVAGAGFVVVLGGVAALVVWRRR